MHIHPDRFALSQYEDSIDEATEDEIEQCQRHETEYRDWRLRELKVAARERGLFTSPVCLGPDLLQWAEKEFYVQAITLADRHRTFPLFFDLPVELCMRVYEYVCVSIPPLRHPAQPPICQASRQLREEAIPVFYGKNCFTFTVLANCGMEPEVPLLRNIDERWLRDFKAYLPWIRKFTFALSKMTDGWVDWIYQACYMNVELAPSSNRCVADFGRHKVNERGAVHLEDLTGYLPGFMDALCRVHAPGRGFDLDAIHEIVDSMILAYEGTATPYMQFDDLSLASLFNSLW